MKYKGFKPELIVTNDQLDDVFDGTNFGTRNYRQLIGECLLKMCCGFGDGSTILRVCRDLGLINKKSYILTKVGQRYLWGYAAPFVMENAMIDSNPMHEFTDAALEGKDSLAAVKKRKKCMRCGGGGKTWILRGDVKSIKLRPETQEACPDCNGTGKVGK